MKNRIPVKAAIAIAVACTILTAIFTSQLCYCFMFLPERQRYNSMAIELSQKNEPPKNEDGSTPLPEKFKSIYEYFIKHYTGQLDEKELETELLKQFFKFTGDRYAEYYTLEEYSALNDSYNGKSVGIGVHVLKTAEGRMAIIYVEEDSPAEKAGIKTGDEIIAVNGKQLSEIGYDAAAAMLQGEKGSEAVFTTARDGEEHEYSITRQEIVTKTIRFSMEEENTGYIRITSFGNNTPDEFKNAVDTLIKNGAKRLVFDVRSNGGGTLTAIHKVLDYLIEDGDEKDPHVVLTTVDALDNQKRYLCTDGHAVNLPMAVLINGTTASAAELFAAALRDYNLAVLVGETTYGKGVAQSTVELDDGTAFKMTTAMYNPPCGVNYDGVGVAPHKEIPSNGVNFNLIPLKDDPVYRAALEALNA